MKRWLSALALGLAACSPPAQAPVGDLVIQIPAGQVEQSGRSVTWDFGRVPSGARRSVDAVLVNAGEVPLALVATASGGLSLDGAGPFNVGALPSGLAPGASEVVRIDYVAAGADEGTLTLAAAGIEPGSLTLRGTGFACGAAPEGVDFGGVAVGQAETRAVLLVNDEPQTVDWTVTPPPEPFGLASGSPAATFTLRPGESRSVGVEVTFAAPGAADARWHLSRSDGCAFDVPLRADAVDTALSVDPAAVDFGFATPPASWRRSVTVSNWLGRALPLHQLTITQAAPVFSVDPVDVVVPAATRDGTTGALLPGTATIGVQAAISATGPSAGVLLLRAVDSTVQVAAVPLRVWGGGPDVRVAPQSLDLGITSIIHGVPLPVVEPVAIANAGPVDPRSEVEILSAEIVEKTGALPGELCVGDYDGARAKCLGVAPGFVVQGGSQRPLPVRVAPRTPGPRWWLVRLATTDKDTPHVEFEVRTTGAVEGECRVQATRSLDFGSVQAPRVVTRPVVLENVGSEVCHLRPFAAAPGSPFFMQPVGAFDLAPGARTLVDVSVRYETPGVTPAPDDRATLEWRVNSLHDPRVAVALSARHERSCVLVTPESWDLGTTAPGCGALRRSFDYVKSCGAQVSVLQVELEGGPEWTLTGGESMPLNGVVVAGSALEVAFQPGGPGEYGAALRVTTLEDGRQLTQVVPLRATVRSDGVQTDTFDVPRKVDVVLVQDEGTAEWALNQWLSSHASDLVESARQRGIDFRIGAIFCDEATPYGRPSGALRQVSGGGRWLSSSDPALVPRLASLMDLSMNGTAMEAFLGPAVTALGDPLVSDPATNAGFLRPDAALGFFMFTHEQEGSSRPSAVLIPQLLAIKGTQRPELISWNAMAPVAVPASQCGYGQTDDGRWESAVVRLGGVHVDPCSSTLLDDVVAVSRRLFGERSKFSLRGAVAQGGGAQVRVDGIAVPELVGGLRAWTLDTQTNTLEFAPGAIPAAGSRITVSYPAVCNP